MDSRLCDDEVLKMPQFKEEIRAQTEGVDGVAKNQNGTWNLSLNTVYVVQHIALLT